MLCKGDIFIINVCTWMINRCGLPLDEQIIIKGQKYLNSTSFSRLRERRRFKKSNNKCWPKYFKNIFTSKDFLEAYVTLDLENDNGIL